jgi:hypothetical protein
LFLSSAGELPDVRYGLLADIGQPIRDVRFAARGDDVRAKAEACLDASNP